MYGKANIKKGQWGKTTTALRMHGILVSGMSMRKKFKKVNIKT